MANLPSSGTKIILTPSQQRFLTEIVAAHKETGKALPLEGKPKIKMANKLYLDMLVEVDDDDTWVEPTEQGIAWVAQHETNVKLLADRKWAIANDAKAQMWKAQKQSHSGKKRPKDQTEHPRPFTLECSASTPAHNAGRLSVKLWEGTEEQAREFMMPKRLWTHTFMATSMREARRKYQTSALFKVTVYPKIKPPAEDLPQ